MTSRFSAGGRRSSSGGSSPASTISASIGASLNSVGKAASSVMISGLRFRRSGERQGSSSSVLQRLLLQRQPLLRLPALLQPLRLERLLLQQPVLLPPALLRASTTARRQGEHGDQQAAHTTVTIRLAFIEILLVVLDLLLARDRWMDTAARSASNYEWSPTLRDRHRTIQLIRRVFQLANCIASALRGVDRNTKYRTAILPASDSGWREGATPMGRSGIWRKDTIGCTRSQSAKVRVIWHARWSFAILDERLTMRGMPTEAAPREHQ